jgi:predicted ArsR family transcriptional regulator
MPPRADRATLNVQPRQRREVYERLSAVSDGRSVRELLDDLAIPETELRETLRKLDEAGLAKRAKTRWWAVPLEGEPTAEAAAEPEQPA